MCVTTGPPVSRTGLIASLVCALLVSAPAARAATRVQRPAVTWVRGDGSYTKASRGVHDHAITMIVIHATDGGTLGGNVWWLSGGHSHASAHYVIARDGSIVQLVHLSDVAWHAGNSKVNRHSIGIEHVGETYDPNGFTAEEYQSSARLVAWLVRRYGIPVDRRHIIGHSQVPDPKNPQLLGGSDHHTDPGPHWRWGYYLNLVRHYAFPDRFALHVDTTTISRGESLDGIVPWRIRVKGAAARHVDFLVDGEVVWRDSRRPFAFAGGRGWNTTQVANGTHTLAVRVTGGGLSAWQRLQVRVVNRDFALTTSKLHPWQKVKGLLRIRANVRGANTSGIGLYVDGKVISRDRSAPFTLRWNSKRVHDGRHRITLAAVARDGRVAKRTLPVVVANRVHPKKVTPKAKAKPSPKVRVVSQNLQNGATVSGGVTWHAHTIGPVARVQFVVDGTVVATMTTEPWTTAWDSSTTSQGSHVLAVRALTKDGRTGSTSSVTVTVAAPEPAPPADPAPVLP
jgi:N-acetyl-anhydromuramyl-L-alanine amidase AmpD